MGQVTVTAHTAAPKQPPTSSWPISDRLAALDGLDAQTRRDLLEAGVVSATYESTFKDGFGALETYLKDRFQQEAKKVTKPPAATTFQRLEDTNELYKQHLGVHLEAAVGPRCGRRCCRLPPSVTC